MVKELKKPNKTSTNTINSILPANKTTPKSRQQIYQENYQKNKETKKTKRKKDTPNKKKQEQLSAQKHYQANSIKVLLTLKEYTELNQAKRKLWYDFMWTIQDCQKSGFYDIIQIQKLEQLAGNLTRDYYQTAKSKNKSSWNSLSEKEQSKLIKYWGQEKVRKEQEIAENLTEQEQQGQVLEKELELAKFHEERGKIKCECWQCEKEKEIQGEIKEQIINDSEEKEKEQCSECKQWVKEVDEESGVCGKCMRKYENG